jgi:hypothetical protein
VFVQERYVHLHGAQRCDVVQKKKTKRLFGQKDLSWEYLNQANIVSDKYIEYLAQFLCCV